MYVKWEIARQNCLQRGGDLAIVDTEMKRKAIDTRLTAIDELLTDIDIRAFIGIQKIGTWQWLGGGHISGDNWHSGNPRLSPVEKCAVIMKSFLQWKLVQTLCRYKVSFVCETEESKYVSMIN